MRSGPWSKVDIRTDMGFTTFKSLQVDSFFISLIYYHCTVVGLGWAGNKGNNAILFYLSFVFMAYVQIYICTLNGKQ